MNKAVKSRLSTLAIANIGIKEKVVFETLPDTQPGPQTIFYNSPATLTLYGGAAGGGKTMAGLLDAAKPNLISIPNYSAVFFRKTYPEIKNEGGLWDESAKIYPKIGGRPIESRLEWKFPSGATIRFTHLQHEKNIYDWQGAQIPRLYFDELTHFTKKQFIYLLSRCRTDIGITPQIKMTCNPDSESWVAKLIDWYIDPSGYPIPDRANKIRYFVNISDSFVWADDPKELMELYPDIPPISFSFIPASIQDNPILLASNPQYLANLKAQHPVDMERLLKGNWRVKYDAGKVLNRQWFEIVDQPPEHFDKIVRFWDLAATKNTLSFYTAGVKIGKVKNTYYILDIVYKKCNPSEGDNLILTTAKQDGIKTFIRWEREGGSAGVRDADHLKNLLTGFNVSDVKPQGDKVTRAKPFGSAAYNGNVKIVNASWNDVYLSALNDFDGSSKPLVNDLVDATSGAFSELFSVVVMPSFI